MPETDFSGREREREEEEGGGVSSIQCFTIYVTSDSLGVCQLLNVATFH